MHDSDADRLLSIQRGLRKLRNRGGSGDPSDGLIEGHVMTVQQSQARALARGIVDAVQAREGKPLHEIPLIAFYDMTQRRSALALQDPGRVGAIVGELVNAAHREVRSW